MSSTGGTVVAATPRGAVDAVGRAPDGRARTARPRWTAAWPAAWGAALGAGLFAVARDAMPDDALISLAYARNLAEHGQWALTTGIETHTATSPLNIALLSVLHLASGERAFVAAAVLLCACLAVVAQLLHRLGGWFPALIGPALLASSPVLSSSVGLETFLTAAVLAGLVVAAVRDWPVVAGLLVAAAVLTRPDLVVPAVVAVGVLAVRRRRMLVALPVGALAAAPWFAFSWWHFGSAWPHTVAVKMAAGAWPQGSITSVDYFWAAFPAATVLTLATFAAGAVATGWAFVHRHRAPAAFGAAGASHLGALAVQDTPPIEYYLAPGVIGLGLALVLVVRSTWRGVPVAIVLDAVLLSVAHGALWGQGLAPMRQNFATTEEYVAIARDLPTDGVVRSTFESGALAFYCQDRGCTVIDRILADPVGTDRYVRQWRAAHPWAEPNYHRYRAPVPGEPPRWELRVVGPEAAAPATWPITRAPGVHQRARLVPVP